jgi:hypothetical protein
VTIVKVLAGCVIKTAASLPLKVGFDCPKGFDEGTQALVAGLDPQAGVKVAADRQPTSGPHAASAGRLERGGDPVERRMRL